MPMRLETIQYRGNPLGHPSENAPRKMGIIHNIMVWLDCCRGSGDGICVIFCCTHVVTATSTGITTLDGSGWLKSIHRNPLFTGTAACIGTNVIHEYSLSERFTRSSGLSNSVSISTRNNPMRIGICTISGPRQPIGFTPLSRYRRIVSWDTRCRSPAYRS